MLKEGSAEVLDHKKSLEHYELTVYETWLPSVQRLLGQGHDKAVELLEVISFYAPRRIPVWMFEADAFEATSFQIETSIGHLVDLSLIERQGEFINVHALVQEVTRHQLQPTAP